MGLLNKIQAGTLVIAGILIWIPYEPTILHIIATIIIAWSVVAEYFN